MKALKEKLNSRRGASILLAMLFLLVCIMVGASIVVAAASNAGKVRSNKEEQQKYLTLSSAVTMLVDELKKVEYYGQYDYSETTNDEGNVIHSYILQEGVLQRQDGNATWLNGNDLSPLLPLRNDLDRIFKDHFEVPPHEQTPGVFPEYLKDGVTLDEAATLYTTPYVLEFKVGANGYGGLSDDKVRMEVTLRQDGSIVLVATLWEGKKDKDGNIIDYDPSDYSMEALLRPEPDEWPEKLLVLPNVPLDENWVSSPSRYRTEKITWDLDYVYKKEAIPSATTP